MNYLKGKKTYIVAGMMVAVSIFKMITGDMSMVEFLMSADLMLLLEGLGLSSLRAGIGSK